MCVAVVVISGDNTVVDDDVDASLGAMQCRQAVAVSSKSSFVRAASSRRPLSGLVMGYSSENIRLDIDVGTECAEIYSSSDLLASCLIYSYALVEYINRFAVDPVVTGAAIAGG